MEFPIFSKVTACNDRCVPKAQRSDAKYDDRSLTSSGLIYSAVPTNDPDRAPSSVPITFASPKSVSLTCHSSFSKIFSG